MVSLNNNNLFKNNYFYFGLVVKVVAICTLMPVIQEELFYPFMLNGLSHFPHDPWASFLQIGGDPTAFPYGMVSYIGLVPFIAISQWLYKMTHHMFPIQMGFGLLLLIADMVLLLTLSKLMPKKEKFLLLFYWLSPVVFYISYWHGQIDLLPVTILFVSIYLLKTKRFTASAACLALSASAKLSSLLFVPFILIYLLPKLSFKPWCYFFGVFLSVFTLLQLVPLFLSPGMRLMVLGSPQFLKLYELSWTLGGGVHIYIAPMVMIFLLYSVWRIKQINFEFLLAILGCSFFVLLLLTPASVGWYLWVVPFMLYFQAHIGVRFTLLASAFWLIFLSYQLLSATGAVVPILGWDFSVPLNQSIADIRLIQSILATVLSAFGVMIVVRFFSYALSGNDYFQIARQPIALGIAGDSGSGKDSLCGVLTDILGERSVTMICGDDYHLHDRYDQIWRSMTPLHPAMNDLQRFMGNVLSLMNKQSIYARSYDHSSGRLTEQKATRARNVILVNGLHALYFNELNQKYAMKIYLDMNETLRRFFKMRRDVLRRNRSREEVIAALDLRIADTKQYILPQSHQADISFGLYAINPDRLKDIEQYPCLGLLMRVPATFPHVLLQHHLVSLCGLGVERWQEEAEIFLRIEGLGPTSKEVAYLAEILVGHLAEIADINPVWQPGMTGLMQLVVLIQLEQHYKTC